MGGVECIGGLHGGRGRCKKGKPGEQYRQQTPTLPSHAHIHPLDRSQSKTRCKGATKPKLHPTRPPTHLLDTKSATMMSDTAPRSPHQLVKAISAQDNAARQAVWLMCEAKSTQVIPSLPKSILRRTPRSRLAAAWQCFGPMLSPPTLSHADTHTFADPFENGVEQDEAARSDQEHEHPDQRDGGITPGRVVQDGHRAAGMCVGWS